MIRVLVVDDHPIVRDGLVAVLSDEPDLEVVGAAGSVKEAVALAARESPDVVLLDLELPETDGVTGISRLKEVMPTVRTIVLTAYDTDERVFGALNAGANGYLLKGVPASEIVRGIRAVYQGGSSLDPHIAARVLATMGTGGRSRLRLSPRERDVLALLAQGLTTKEMARSLSISERTVKFHITSIFTKLGASNRAQAVALALQQHLL